MKQKIGVLTVHKNINYGANLQAFASSTYLIKQGYDCKVIDYTLPEHEKANHLFSWLKQSWDGETGKSLSRKLKLFVALTLSIGWKRKRLKTFNTFRKKHMPLYPTADSVPEISRLGLDTVVCGSDQVWNTNIMGGVVPAFYGEIGGVKKRISYAASMGKNEFTEEEKSLVSRLVNRIDYCSVRERDAAEYLSSISGKNIEVVCDPVFLLDKQDYEKIQGKRKIKGEYVLLYSIIQDEKMTKMAKDYAKKNNLKLIEICMSKDKKATHKQIVTYGPCEFLNAFAHANTVFTNSFHGTAFSLIYEKKFYIVNNKHGGSRIVNILDKAGAMCRLVENSYEECTGELDYDSVRKNIQEYVKSSKEFLNKALSAEKITVAGESCVGCGACAAVCKLDAVKMTRNKEGFLTSFIDTDKCVDCGQCKAVCPSLNDVAKHKPPVEVYAFKAVDDLRKSSTSGGAFAALATEALERGGAVYGASLDKGFKVSHRRIEAAEDLALLQGTKYLQSDISHIYSLLESDLKAGREVLFSGTPCQVDGVNSFVRQRRLPSDKLYTVDIICHGVPSSRVFDDYMEWLSDKFKSQVVEYKFRDKRISWRGNSCYAKLENGRELKNEKKLSGFMNLYYSNNITRNSCHECRYTSRERVSDLTVSDYWGLENLSREFEDALGVSMVMVNTERGKELFDKAKGERIVGNLDCVKQPQLNHPTEKPSTREEFWQSYEQKGVAFALKGYGGVKRDSLKTVIRNFIK